MRELIVEVVLRLLKPMVATVFGAAIWVLVVGILGAEGTPETFVLCWIAGAVLVLMGLVWTLQGFGVIGGSAMSGSTTWAIIGPIVRYFRVSA